MTDSLALSFALTALLIELTPGPNMVWLALLSAQRGRSAGFAATAGIALGLAVLAVTAIFGIARVIEDNPALYRYVSIAGVLFMLWLAWDAWKPPSSRQVEDQSSRRSRTQAFRRGLVINLLNPKAALFFLTVMPNFLDPQRDIGRQYLLLSVIYLGIATGIHLLLVLGGERVGRLLAEHAHGLGVRLVSAFALVGVAGWMLAKAV